MFSRNAQLVMTPEHMTAVLIEFGDTLDVFAHQLSCDREGLATLVADAAASIRELAREVGEGDREEALEIVTSTVRLVCALRGVVDGSKSKSMIN